MEKISRIKGALYGAVIGDALGAPVEFMSQRQIKATLGEVRDMIGGGWLKLAPGEGTDETALLLSTACGIIADSNNPCPQVGKHFINWAISSPKDINETTLRSIDRTMAKSHGNFAVPKARWHESAAQTDVYSNRGSIDNGAILNTLYPALYYKEEYDAIEKALDISNMTHVNTQSDNACRLYVQFIFRILHENIDKIAMEDIIANSMYHSYAQETVQPTISAFDSIVAMLHAFMETDNFEDALVKAVNYGGDSDTIGAITGGLAGCYYGYEAIPQRFIEALPKDIHKMLEIISKAIK